MIGYLEGRLLEVFTDSAILLTPGGVGYQVHLTIPNLAVLRENPGQTVKFHTVTIVREDELALYGFDSLDAKELFEMLVRVSGIGPKLALAMLSTYQPPQLVQAILAQETVFLTAIPGIGKKTASRLCVELSDRLSDWGVLPSMPKGARNDLISALTNLGFPEKDVMSVLNILPDDRPFQEQFKTALEKLKP